LSKEAFDKMVLSAKVIRGWGDCYGHILVATGRAEIMFDPVVALWDSAPMGVIVEEAGGRAFDFNGNDTIYSPNVITTNAALADKVKGLLRA
jgi:myo-inositol-1(or 4)-monophosphatase